MEVKRTVPILRIFDLVKAKEFYVDFLGFKLDWEHRFEGVAPVYMQVSGNGLSLHLTEHYGDCCPGSTVFCDVIGLEEFHRELNNKKYGYLRPGIEDTPWGSRMMEIIDPFGNRIRFNENRD